MQLTLLLCKQGTLVGKVLTKADVEHCRVALPRLAMEANMPEVVDANTLHVVSALPKFMCVFMHSFRTDSNMQAFLRHVHMPWCVE